MFASWLLAVCVGAVCLERQMAASLTVQNHKLDLVFEWKYIDYLYDNKEQEAAVKNENGYIKENNVPIDVDRTNDGRTFVTVPRDKGVCSTLNVVSDQHGDGGPLLKPYPNWDAAKTDCSGIYSVYRVAICRDVLYAVDNGQANNGTQVCPPRLYMFDLTTDKILKNLTIPMDVATNTTTNKGLLITPIVPCCNPYDDHNVYIADVAGYAIVVYHTDTEKFSRITGGPLNYDPKATTYTIENQSFELDDGPVGMAFSCPCRTLALSPMSSHNLAFITQTDLDHSFGDVPIRNFQGILPTQSSAKAYSHGGILFFGLVNNTSIACWNERRPLDQQNMIVIAENTEQMQFTSGLKVKQIVSRWGEQEHMYALSNRYQKAATGTLNVNEINFRILRGIVSELVRGTRCAGYFFY